MSGTKDTPVFSSKIFSNSFVLFTVIIALFASLSVYSIYSVGSFLKGRELVQKAERQRILNERYAKEILLAAQGITSATHESTLQGMTEGLADLLKGSSDSVLRENLQSQQTLLTRLTDESRRLLKAAQKTSLQNQTVLLLYQVGTELQNSAEEVVRSYDRHLETGIPWWKEEAVAIEIAERQKILIQKLIKETLLVSYGIAADFQDTRLRLLDSVNLLTNGGPISLSTQDTISVPLPPNDDVRTALAEQKRKIEEYTSVSNEYFAVAGEAKNISVLAASFFKINQEFALAAERSWSIVDYSSKERLHGLVPGMTVALILLVLVSAAGFWALLRFSIARPLNSVLDGLKRISQGDTSVRIPEETTGEIGLIAQEVNRTAKNLEAKIQFLDQWIRGHHQQEIRLSSSDDKIGQTFKEWMRLFGGARSEEVRASLAPAASVDIEENMDEELSIVGNLPEIDDDGGVDKEILEQLLTRTQELNIQKEQLELVNEELREQTASLNAYKEKLKSAELELESGVASTGEVIEQVEVIELQRREMQEMNIRLREQLDYLRQSEERLVSQHEELNQINQALMRQTEEQKEQLHSLNYSLQEKTNSLIGIKNELQTKDEELRVRDEELRIRDEELVRKEEENIAKQSELRNKENLLQSLTRQIREKEERLKEVHTDLTEFESQQEQLIQQTHVQSEELDKLYAQLQKSGQDISERNAQVERANNEIIAGRRTILSQNEELARLAAELEQRGNTLRDMQSNLAVKLMKIDEVGKKVTSLEGELQQAREAIQDADLRFRELEKKESEALTNLRHEREIRRSQSVLLENSERRVQVLQEELRESRESSDAWQNRMRVVEHDLQKKLEAERNIKTLQKEDYENRVKAIEQNLQKKLEDERNLKALQKEDYESRFAQMREKMQMLEVDVEERLRQAEAAYSDKLSQVRLEYENRIARERDDHDGKMTELRVIVNQKTTELQGRQNEIRQKSDQLLDLQSRLNVAQDQILALQDQSGRRSIELNELRAQMNRTETELANTKGEAQRLQQQLRAAEERLVSTRHALKASIEELQERDPSRM